MSSISLICFTYLIMFLKETRTSISSWALMLHQDTRSLGPLETKNQARLHLCWKQSMRRVACLSTQTFQCDNGPEFKSEAIKLLEKHNADIRKYKHTHTVFVEAFNKELEKLLFKPMDAQELQDPEKVSTIWDKYLDKTVKKKNNTISSMCGRKPKDGIKLDPIPLDKTYPEETVLPEDGL